MPDPLTECRDELARVVRERELYAQLLDLGRIDDPEALLKRALAVAVAEASAVKGYLAVFPPEHRLGDAPQWATAIGCSSDDEAQFRREFSSTIIDDTLQTRRVVMVASAGGSPRYQAKDSVRANKITSVVCAPIGGEATGILYLQGKHVGIFTSDDERFVVQLGQHLGRWIDRLLHREGASTLGDATRVHRRGAAFERLAGRSRALATVLEAGRRLARLPVPVLVTGPPGSGKTTFAEELHLLSARSHGPLVVVDAGTHPPRELAADLVGGPDGEGLFAEAEHGTLVVDHVDAMAPDAQRVLADAVETGRYRPIGASEARVFDVRLVAVTSVDLGAARAGGTFLASLHGLLDVHVVRMPSLRERAEDVPLLVEALGRRVAAELGVPWPGADPTALAFVADAAWPRQLRDVRLAIEAALRATAGRRPLREDDLEVPAAPAVSSTPVSGAPWFELPAGARLLQWKDAERLFKKGYLLTALERHGGNITRTGEALGLSRSRMFALMNELELRAGGE